jgi:hypothetical protein
VEENVGITKLLTRTEPQSLSLVAPFPQQTVTVKQPAAVQLSLAQKATGPELGTTGQSAANFKTRDVTRL